MAIERSERGHRWEEYPKRDREREYDERGLSEERNSEYAESRDGRASGRRHWRGHDYHDYNDAAEFERGRDPGDYDVETRRSLAARHRERFLRRGPNEEYSGEYIGGRAGDWSERDRWNDDWSGPYAGRGPKGYKRSDDRILEDVCERLTSHPSIDATDIEVQVSGGDVTLGGRVESRAVKHLTEAMVETVSGVKEVHNHLRVGVEGEWPRSTPVERPPQPIEPKRRR